ncbi:2OG-Fe(II) oxygenase, putative [Bodo saltans]|uniref:2OG-Fe(II) oxygenase, putative n=1 Tax=Bodo saltans TaxID=75058 RepID=A0A0S4IPR8_BODSA|nr:2OG-Fe(II) oxygenase, putative [Bodo saltans]|eukprot:CUF89090.1 2OG-Fe(II) oxygenase, putative [Bodo saltans]
MAIATKIPLVNVECLNSLTKALISSAKPDQPLTISNVAIEAWYDANTVAVQQCARSIREAFRTMGFMYIENHGIPQELQDQLDASSRKFFKLPLEEKMRIRMSRGGLAWRGFFPVGGELTSGKPDIKEGLYCGQERSAQDPRVKARTPLFGSNLFPEKPAALAQAVLDYMKYCEAVGQGLLIMVAISVGLHPTYFIESSCADPTCLFRVFHYPPPATLKDPKLRDRSLWGVGEHTDYGLLTLLKQDNVGGLEVKRLDGQWVAAPPIPNTLVVNIGDMMESMSGGLFMSTPHRVLNRGGPDAMRLSFPFFFDPGFHAHVPPLPLTKKQQDDARETVAMRAMLLQQRWDLTGVTVAIKPDETYGDYLLRKVGKVFPELAKSTSATTPPTKSEQSKL